MRERLESDATFLDAGGRGGNDAEGGAKEGEGAPLRLFAHPCFDFSEARASWALFGIGRSPSLNADGRNVCGRLDSVGDMGGMFERDRRVFGMSVLE